MPTMTARGISILKNIFSVERCRPVTEIQSVFKDKKPRNQTEMEDNKMSKDGTNRGGSRPGAGRKPKALT